MAAVDGHGTILAYSDSSGGSYTDVALVTSIDGGGASRGTADVTNLSSTAREFILNGFHEAGELSLDVVYDPCEDTQEFFSTQITSADPTLKYYRITFPVPSGTTATYICAGWVTGFSPSVEFEGALTCSITIQLTGAATFTTT